MRLLEAPRKRDALASAWLVATCVAIGAAGAVPVGAQGPGDTQSRLLLEAATLESRGDLEGAEAALRRLLDTDPGSAGAVFALERVLRAQGEEHELRPIVDAFLARGTDVDVRALKLDLMVEADSVQAMISEAERWLASEQSEETFRAVAGVYEPALGPERALEVLRRGRTVLGGGALALPTGDLLAATGDLEGAVDEWALAIEEDGSGMEPVRSRLGRLGEDRIDAARHLVRILGDSAVPQRRRATLRLAIELGLEPEALALARQHAQGLGGRAKTTFLTETGILARQSEMAAVASWAYEELGEVASSPEERRQYDQRIADIALESGDTAAALLAQRRVVASYGSRSDDWRRAHAEAIKLEATAEPEQVHESWGAFRADFPNAPELDAVAAAIALSMQTRGDLEGAAAVLEGIEGPRSSLERAYLLLGEGDIEGGRGMLLRAVGGLLPSEATPVIQLASLLGRLSGPAAEALVSASVAAHRGRAADAARTLAERAAALGGPDSAPLLAEAARIAERSGAETTAVEIRRSLVEDHPDAPEVAEATLALARRAAWEGGDRSEAIQLLEELITRRPNAAVVPEARLELERLRRLGS